jgi:hypothetical protein
MIKETMTFEEIPPWHREILAKLLRADFPGKAEITQQINTARFRIIDANQSLGISALDSLVAPVVKTIPVEAYATDQDGALVQIMLFTRGGRAYMLEILREDGNSVREFPLIEKFTVLVLAP